MPSRTLKPIHKAVTAYCDSLAKFAKPGIKHEGAVRSAFHGLLEQCARQFDWKLRSRIPHQTQRPGRHENRLDDEQCIVRLIGQVIAVSLETVKVVKGLPPL